MEVMYNIWVCPMEPFPFFFCLDVIFSDDLEKYIFMFGRIVSVWFIEWLCGKEFPYPQLTSDGDCSGVLHTHIYMYMYIYIYTYTYVCVHVCIYIGFIYYCRHRTLWCQLVCLLVHPLSSYVTLRKIKLSVPHHPYV